MNLQMPKAWVAQTADIQEEREEVGWASSYPGPWKEATAECWRNLQKHWVDWAEHFAFPLFCLEKMCSLPAMDNFILLCCLHLCTFLHRWRCYFVISNQCFRVLLFGDFFFSKDIWEVWFCIMKPKVIYLGNLSYHSVYSICLYITHTMQIVTVNHSGQMWRRLWVLKCDFIPMIHTPALCFLNSVAQGQRPWVLPQQTYPYIEIHTQLSLWASWVPAVASKIFLH